MTGRFTEIHRITAVQFDYNFFSKSLIMERSTISELNANLRNDLEPIYLSIFYSTIMAIVCRKQISTENFLEVSSFQQDQSIKICIIHAQKNKFKQ